MPPGAEIRLDDCLLSHGRECDRCVASCDYDAVAIGGGTFEPEPVVDAARCVGCGACAAICPPAVISVTPCPAVDLVGRSESL